MIDKLGKDNALMREAMRAAQKVVSDRSAALENPAAAASGAGAETSTRGVDFSSALESGLRKVEGDIQAAESLPASLLTGKIGDFHEIAVQLKSAEISFKFAMEIRNKLVDAYREIMRMNV